MSFWVQAAILVATLILGYLLRPRIDQNQEPGDFSPPEPREGEPFTVVFGTAKVSANITWFGDVQVEEVEKEVSALFGLITEEVPLGFEYFAGMMLTICLGPVDELLDIMVGDFFLSEQAWDSVVFAGGGFTVASQDPTDPLFPIQGTTDPTPIRINTPELFGGPESGGGVEGRLDFHWGSVEQGPNDYLSVFWPADILPHYRRVCYAVLRRMNLGKSPTPQPWWFVVKRIPDVLGQSATAEIDGDANPAEILYELITNKLWGLGKDPSLLDLASFQAAASTLNAENLGLSLSLKTQGEANDAIRNVLQHINATVFQHPSTGLITLFLIRNDYSIGSLPRLGQSDGELVEFRRGSWRETVNETRVRYTSRKRRWTTAVAQAQNDASIQAMGEVVTQTIDLPGYSNHAIAQREAERLNRASSVPMARGIYLANRKAGLFHEGMPFVLEHPAYGIDELVCRVTSIDYGNLLDGAVEITWVQDVWDLSGVAFGEPDSEGLEPCGPLNLLVPGYDPADDPSADYGDGQALLVEAPYWHVGAKRRAWASASRSEATEVHWLPFRSEQGLAYVDLEQELEFDPVGLLDAEVPKTTAATGVSLTVRNLGELRSLTSTDAAGRLAGNRLLMIGGEIMAWETIVDNGDGTYTIGGVMRGQLDTVPEHHIIGDRVFFYFSSEGPDGHHDVSSGDYADFSSVAIRPVRVDQDGSRPLLEEVPALSVVLHDRAFAPYPPGKVELNGSGYAVWPADVVGDATLTWVDRSRVDQTEMVAQDDATSFTREGTVDIEALIDGEVVRQWLSEPSNSVTYTLAQRQSDDADLTKRVQFRITPRGGSGEVGGVRTTPPFTMSSP